MNKSTLTNEQEKNKSNRTTMRWGVSTSQIQVSSVFKLYFQNCNLFFNWIHIFTARTQNMVYFLNYLLEANWNASEDVTRLEIH